MPDSILIGPVPGVPETVSIEIIVQDILDKTPDNLRLFEKYADRFSSNSSKGVMIVHMKPHLVADIDDLFIPLATQTKKVSGDRRTPIECKMVDRGFEMGDNEGNEPYTPPIGPRQGPPTREEHEPEPDPEYLASVDVGLKEPDWRGVEDDRRSDGGTDILPLKQAPDQPSSSVSNSPLGFGNDARIRS